MNAGGDALADYEMLELVLFMALSRGDTKPLAKALLERFGSYAEVINATPQALKEVKGIGDSAVIAFKVVREAALRMARDELIDKPVLSSWQKLIDYCRASMAYQQIEQFRLISK